MAKEYIEKEVAITILEENYKQACMVGAFDGAARLVAAMGEIKAVPAANVREVGPVQTKGDEIRAMSDEELAKWLTKHHACDTCPKYGSCPGFGNGKCRDSWLYWLKSPVEVDNG